jgi:4-hydroxy-2-oxoheptanedioate aldolase
METCNRILATAHKHGKKACMHCTTASFAAGAIKRGFDLVMLTSDINSMVSGAKKQLDDLKAALA